MKSEQYNFTQPTNFLWKENNPGNGILSCDQVHWLLQMADRYLPRELYPSISKQREMQKYAMLYEIMDLCNLRFGEIAAMTNGTPRYVIDDEPESERAE